VRHGGQRLAVPSTREYGLCGMALLSTPGYTAILLPALVGSASDGQVVNGVCCGCGRLCSVSGSTGCSPWCAVHGIAGYYVGHYARGTHGVLDGTVCRTVQCGNDISSWADRAV
jgi:hypothetical protein